MAEKQYPQGDVVLPTTRANQPILETTEDDHEEAIEPEQLKALEKKIRLKVDLRLCTIGGILCCLNLLDSGILSSASVTSMPRDLDLQGTRFSVAIFIFTIASVVFQLPCTVAARFAGPRLWFASITFCFGLITLCTAFVQTWRQMIALRVLLGISMSGIYPGLTYLVSTWYPRQEQQLRFAFLQCGEVILLATGTIVNYALNHLNGHAGLAGWRWMYLVQGIITCILGIITYWWMIDFPDHAEKSFCFLSATESRIARQRIRSDRDDVVPDPFSWSKLLVNFTDPKIYGFACMFFLLNMVSTSLSYFLPIILQSGMNFSPDQSILLSTPPYYYSPLPVLLTSFLSDRLNLRSPLITFNATCLITGFCMLGFVPQSHVAARYIGTFLATGAYISNWAALNAFQANNVVGQWKRATTAAAVTACNGLGGVAGSFIVRQNEAPTYSTAVWVCVASHVLLVCIVGLFVAYFGFANRRQKSAGVVIQGMVGSLILFIG